MGDTAVVEDVALWGSLEGFLVLEDAVLETPDLFSEAMVLHRSVGFAVGDGGEESVRNGAKEYRIDVVIGGEG